MIEFHGSIIGGLVNISYKHSVLHDGRNRVIEAPAPYFRKCFACKGKVKKAEILASALGVYKIYVNGKAVSDDYLSPGWVDYNKKLPFMRFDITELLSEKNGVGIVLGDGWLLP